MTRKLVLIIVASALLSAALAVIGHFAFPDVHAFVPGEEESASWVREVAFMVTATAWISAELSGLLAIVLLAYLWRKRTPRAS